MLAPDRGTRNLLPLLIDKPEEIVRAAEDGGTIRPPLDPGMPDPDIPSRTADAPGIAETQQKAGAVVYPTTPPSGHGPATHNSSPRGDVSRDDESAGEHDIRAGDVRSGAGAASAHADSVGTAHAMPGGSGHAEPRLPDTAETGDDSSTSDRSTSDDPSEDRESSSSTVIDAPTEPGVLPGASVPITEVPITEPEGDILHIVQTAIVDQDADVLLNGWTGESEIRIFMENDADIDQDADVDLDPGSRGAMRLHLDQMTTINQDTEIDLDIYEVNDVLHVDLYLKNEVDIEQDTELALMMDGWSSENYVLVENDLDVRQNADVDVDIEDELEEKFAIKVAIGLKQAIDVDQDADIGLSYANGGFGADVEAVQSAIIDQDTTLKIDFSVV